MLSALCLPLAFSLGPTPLRPAAMRASAPAMMAIEPPKLDGPEIKVSENLQSVVPSNLIEGSEAPKDFVSQVPYQPPVVLPDWAKEGPVFRRAEFWSNGTATVFEVINVLGRFESANEWGAREFFIDVPPQLARKEIEDNSWTEKRYAMAQRMGTVERVAMQHNMVDLEKLPFTNAKLAASVGRTVEDFETVPISRVAVDVVFDALVESKSSLIAPEVCDRRRGGIVGADSGEFNEGAFRMGLYKARSIVIASWFLLGKGNFVWILVGVQFLHDARPDLFPTPKDLDLFKIFAII